MGGSFFVAVCTVCNRDNAAEAAAATAGFLASFSFTSVSSARERFFLPDAETAPSDAPVFE